MLLGVFQGLSRDHWWGQKTDGGDLTWHVGKSLHSTVGEEWDLLLIPPPLSLPRRELLCSITHSMDPQTTKPSDHRLVSFFPEASQKNCPCSLILSRFSRCCSSLPHSLNHPRYFNGLTANLCVSLTFTSLVFGSTYSIHLKLFEFGNWPEQVTLICFETPCDFMLCIHNCMLTAYVKKRIHKAHGIKHMYSGIFYLIYIMSSVQDNVCST